MRFILGMLGTMVALDLLWLGFSTWMAKPPLARIVVLFFSLAQLAGLLWLLSRRFSRAGSASLLAKFGFSTLFIWHMIVLPLVLIGVVASLVVSLVVLPIHFIRRHNRPPVVAKEHRSDSWTRRDFVRTAVALAPPLLNLSLATIALRQLDRFRVRRFSIPIVDLPPDLHGLTIAQVSDMHVGRFTSGQVLQEMVRVVNELHPDLVLLTGDLINDALADLDHALEIAKRMQGRLGSYLIEGNHDLIQNPTEFESRARSSGIPFLRDDSALLNVGASSLQLFGLSWTRTYENRDAAIAASVRRLLTQRQPGAFPILLAHHPHAFDAAAESQIPLTLSGHTHGGQLMLNEQVGFGPAMFRYWSGLYRRDGSNLVVSNGVGNWFPLRVRAPAEIIHITLRRV
jgi:predicted MPP superfamily phosphohydrolase